MGNPNNPNDEPEHDQSGYGDASGADYPQAAEKDGIVDLSDTVDAETMIDDPNFLSSGQEGVEDGQDVHDDEGSYLVEDDQPGALKSLLQHKFARPVLVLLGAASVTAIIAYFAPPPGQRSQVSTGFVEQGAIDDPFGQQASTTNPGTPEQSALAPTANTPEDMISVSLGEEPLQGDNAVAEDAFQPRQIAEAISAAQGEPAQAAASPRDNQLVNNGPDALAPAQGDLAALVPAPVTEAQNAAQPAAETYAATVPATATEQQMAAQIAQLQEANALLAGEMAKLGQAVGMLSQQTADPELANLLKDTLDKTSAALKKMDGLERKMNKFIGDSNNRFDKMEAKVAAAQTPAPTVEHKASAPVPSAVETAEITATTLAQAPVGPGEWVIVAVDGEVAWVAPRNDRRNTEKLLRLSAKDKKSRFGQVFEVTTDDNGRYIVRTADGIISEG